VTLGRNSYSRYISPEEQHLYDHLLYWVQIESPDQLIERYRALFIDGTDYSEYQVLLTVDRITASRFASTEFKFVLNRCCHILINRWQMQPQLHGAIPKLIALFESSPSRIVTNSFRSAAIKRLRRLVKLFTESEQYITLGRLAKVMTKTTTQSSASNEPLGTLIRRYPYLYEHCLLSEDCTSEHQWVVRKIRGQVQREFEIDLSKYVTHYVRYKTAAKDGSYSSSVRLIQPLRNPTLLSERELNIALKQFVGKGQDGSTYRDIAQSFLKQSHRSHSYSAFKNELYEYLTASIDPDYGKRQFNQRLYACLQSTLPHSDAHKLDEFLLIRTCSQLLNFLVVESSKRPHHYIFVDLITNQGSTVATGLLLKIVLLCRKVKPYLEKRFSILFNHYESSITDGIQWLVESLEKLNLALSIHFGAMDISCLNQIL
jgi:hypothetical protein